MPSPTPDEFLTGGRWAIDQDAAYLRAQLAEDGVVLDGPTVQVVLEEIVAMVIELGEAADEEYDGVLPAPTVLGVMLGKAQTFAQALGLDEFAERCDKSLQLLARAMLSEGGS